MQRRNFLKAGGLSLAAGMISGFPAIGHAASKPVIKIGHLPITDHLTIIAHGQYEYKNVVLEPVKFSGWPELSEALRAGAIQGAFALTPIGITLRQKGTPVKVVMAGHRNGSVLTSRPEINSVDDLKGKTIAIPSRFSTHNLLIHKILADKGIDPDKDVKLIDMAPPEMVNALATGRIDAFIVAEPFGAQAELQKVGKVLVLTRDVWKDHICCTLNIHESVIGQNPEAVEELVGNFTRAAKFIEANPQEAAKLSQKYLGQKPEVIEHVLTRPKGRVSFDNLTPSVQDIATSQDYMVQYGVTKQKIDIASYLDDRFVRKAYA
ncbi:MAG: ABC transporter substrate-binding protein [Rhodocyclales bacterium]|nr:ABC transporter substrate-binding protein [Rhodocyclales bacterium]